jgi:hypothetical protein
VRERPAHTRKHVSGLKGCAAAGGVAWGS